MDNFNILWENEQVGVSDGGGLNKKIFQSVKKLKWIKGEWTQQPQAHFSILISSGKCLSVNTVKKNYCPFLRITDPFLQ